MDQQDGSLTTFVCAFHEDDNIAQHMEIRERGGRGRRDTRKNLPSFFFFPESTELLHWMRGISPGAGRHPGHGGLGRRGDETQALPPPPLVLGSVCVLRSACGWEADDAGAGFTESFWPATPQCFSADGFWWCWWCCLSRGPVKGHRGRTWAVTHWVAICKPYGCAQHAWVSRLLSPDASCPLSMWPLHSYASTVFHIRAVMW